MPPTSSRPTKVNDMGTKKWSEIKASVAQTPEREIRVAQARVELDAEIRSYNLTELRRLVSSVTQGDLANILGMNQSAISKTERADDMTVSRLRAIVEAIGGTLTLIATFNDTPVALALGRTSTPTLPPNWVAIAQRWAAENRPVPPLYTETSVGAADVAARAGGG